MDVTCPSCKSPLTVQAETGNAFECSTCGERFTAPSEAEPSLPEAEAVPTPGSSQRPMRVGLGILGVLVAVLVAGLLLTQGGRHSVSGSVLLPGVPGAGCPPVDEPVTASVEDEDGESLGSGPVEFASEEGGCRLSFSFAVGDAETDSYVLVFTTPGEPGDEVVTVGADELQAADWSMDEVLENLVTGGGDSGGGAQDGGTVSASGDVSVEGSPRDAPLKKGDMVPGFSAPELTDGTVDWANYRGKPVALAIWASWCPSCQQEMPVLQELSRGFPEVSVVSIVTSQGQEPGPTPEQYVADVGITFPVAVDDASGKLRSAMGVTGFPTLYLVNRDGSVKEAVVGLQDPEVLRSQFQALASP